MDTPSLFSNTDPACKPNTTKSKICGEGDRLFIQTEIEKMIREDVIEESTSPWRAQVLIVTNERQRKRLVVDYSGTVNRFTRLDAYPLPRMNDLAQEIAKYKIDEPRGIELSESRTASIENETSIASTENIHYSKPK